MKRWDKQERRNYGETVHEDNDILGIFTPEEYTHVTPGWGAVQVVRLHQLMSNASPRSNTLCRAASLQPSQPSASL